MKYVLNVIFGMVMLWLSAGYAVAQQVETLETERFGTVEHSAGELQRDYADRRRALCVVSDKETRDGFFVFRIVQDERTGQVTEVVNEDSVERIPL